MLKIFCVYCMSKFWSKKKKKKKKKVYTCLPQFCYIKVGYKGVDITRTYYRDVFTIPAYRRVNVICLFGLANATCPKYIFIRKRCPWNKYPLKPHFYIEETGVCKGIHIFHIFAPKYRLWVLVRTASPRRF